MLLWSDRYGSAERVYRLEFVSNSDFNDSEFSKWRETVMMQGMSLPTTYEVEQKAKDIKFALDYKFNEEDVDMVRFTFSNLCVCCFCYILLLIAFRCCYCYCFCCVITVICELTELHGLSVTIPSLPCKTHRICMNPTGAIC